MRRKKNEFHTNNLAGDGKREFLFLHPHCRNNTSSAYDSREEKEMKKLICFTLALIVMISLSACTSSPTPEPTEPINWSVVEEVGRDGDEVHYREHFSNGMTVDRYTREGE